MGTPINLTVQEQALKEQLQRYLKDIKYLLNRHDDLSNNESFQMLHLKMADIAHQLHMSLKNRNIQPKHHKYMLKNRGCSPLTKKFYEHIHPVEDLLAFTDDNTANDDPEDITIGKKFEMHIFTRRWKHKDLYSITRTVNGWDIEAMSFNGKCNKNAAPILYKALEHDGVCYPKQVGMFFEWLWNKAKDDGLSEERVQDLINKICNWINMCEKNTPKDIFKELI